jgi:hypothetical protein
MHIPSRYTHSVFSGPSTLIGYIEHQSVQKESIPNEHCPRSSVTKDLSSDYQDGPLDDVEVLDSTSSFLSI